MAVLNSNLKRIFLIASLVLLLSACSNLQSAATDLIESGDSQEAASASAASDEASNIASAAQEEGESVQQVATPTLSATNEPTAEPTPAEEAAEEEQSSPTPEEVPPTEEPTVEPTPEITPEPTALPEPTPLPVSITSNTADMILINGGEFEMGAEAALLLEECVLFREGCDELGFERSEPIHMVQVDPFYLDVYEVTNEAFLEFLNELEDIETGCAGQLCFDANDSRLEAGDDGQFTVDEAFFEHPLTGATWYGAFAFCEWRDSRLPTEAEWELAASWDSEGAEKRFYPWGDDFDGTVLNFCDINCEEAHASSDFDDGFANTAPVGSYEDGRSPAGAYDMAGNVWEWVNDWLGDDYYRQSAEANPEGPEEGEGKVVRGGSWIDTGNFSATTVRFPAPPLESGDSIGFRCAIDAIPVEEVLAQAPKGETAPETAEESDAEVAEETTEEADTEVAEETTEEADAAVEEPEATPEAVSVNCDLRPGIDNGSTYIVGNCDWLEKIAIRLGISYHELLAANPQIKDPNIIYPGQVLNLPPRAGAAGSPPPSGRPPGAQGPPFSRPQPPGDGLGG